MKPMPQTPWMTEHIVRWRVKVIGKKVKCKLMIAKAVGFSEYIAASISSVQTKELENGNHQISRGKFDPVQYCAYFAERKYFESTTQWQPYDKSYCDTKLPLHWKNSSKPNLIAFPCYNHITTAGTVIALSEQSDQLDTTDNLGLN
jgi:hypothetical protein